jgi:hypothetical protein
MTFDLSAHDAALREKAHAFGQTVAARATDIDRTGAVPEDIAREAAALTNGEPLSVVIAVEQIAAASAAVATVAAARGGGTLALTGLRGGSDLGTSAQGQLLLAAVALGIGRAALDASLAELRRSKEVPGADVEKPHWVVADVATDLDAARLLTYKAARTSNDADIAVARLMASSAATRAVDAAVRVVGTAALTEGSVIERLSRDVRAVSVLSGSEEDQRAAAAEGLLPH